jgi:hypothetical protein
MRASTAAGPLRDFYEALLAKVSRPTTARLTLVRKITVITLIVWKRGVNFDAKHLNRRRFAHILKLARSFALG